MTTTCLLDPFSALDDPRQSWQVCYSLEEVLLKADTCAHHDTFNSGHGRVEIQRHGVCHDIN